MRQTEKSSLTRFYRGQEIRAEVEILDFGVQALLLGGERTHVGAVAAADEQGNLQVITLPGHKETKLALMFARTLYETGREPVAVTAGIHYDNLGKEDIVKVTELAEELIREISETAGRQMNQSMLPELKG